MQTKKLRANAIVDIYNVFDDLVFIKTDVGNYTGTKGKVTGQWTIEPYDWSFEEFLEDWEFQRPVWTIPKNSGYVCDILKNAIIK